MELHQLIDANQDVFVEPCELFVCLSGDKIFSCYCKPKESDPDDVEDIIQAIIDICCLDIYNDDLCAKYTIDVVFTQNDMTGQAIEITKMNRSLRICIKSGIKNVTRTIMLD
jgi:hypothetical protein